MVTGHVVFRGSPAEVMYQHQHAPLPLEQLEAVPQPVVVLLEVLLEKDPARRFQNSDRTSEGDTDDNRRYRRTGVESLVRASRKTPSADFACRNSQAASKTWTEENFRSQIARYRKRCFWSRGGYRFSGCVHGQTRMSTSLQSLPGPVSGSLRSSTIGSDEWLLNIIVLRSSFLAGLSTDRAPAGTLRPQMNFLTLLSLGLEIQIHGSERRGRRAKDWRNSSRIVERYWFWTAWSRSKIRLVHKKDDYAILPSRRFLRELAAFNTGLCVITTRMPVADIADHERTSALRRDLEQLSSDAGAKLLRALGVKGR